LLVFALNWVAGLGLINADGCLIFMVFSIVNLWVDLFALSSVVDPFYLGWWLYSAVFLFAVQAER
jgi:hypothetical protein